MVFVVAVFLEQEGLKLEGSVSAEALVGIACWVLMVVGMGGAICCDSSFFPWIASLQWLERVIEGRVRSEFGFGQGVESGVKGSIWLRGKARR